MAVPQTAAINPYAAPKAAVDDAAAEMQPVRIFSVSGRIGRARYVVNLIGWNMLFGGLVPGHAGKQPFRGAWLLPAIFVIGIVAAIALPAYQDYVKRAQQAGQHR